jgi:hypothetical protein
MWYVEQRHNPNKVIGMPDEYPWIASDVQIENSIEITTENYNILLAAYNVAGLEKQEIADVTPRQMRQAMILSGISIPSIEAAIQTLPEPNRSLAQVEWEYSIAFKRSNPLVAMIGVVVGKTPAEIDSLWLLAATI